MIFSKKKDKKIYKLTKKDTLHSGLGAVGHELYIIG